MKLTNELKPSALTGGQMKTINFRISMKPEDQLMVANILSDSLYTDKIAAILREYGCNAVDANIEAGKPDLPIEVTLPNRLEANLRIRDFGLGMTFEQVDETFCNLGASTKRNSNSVIGMLGIGGKSGFAYGDMFNVTSWHGGTKTVYSCYR